MMTKHPYKSTDVNIDFKILRTGLLSLGKNATFVKKIKKFESNGIVVLIPSQSVTTPGTTKCVQYILVLVHLGLVSFVQSLYYPSNYKRFIILLNYI